MSTVLIVGASRGIGVETAIAEIIRDFADLHRRDRRAAGGSSRSGLEAQRQPSEAHTDCAVLSACGHTGGGSCRYPVRTDTRD
jgi:NAD(P)-dependent dehydrogenase (short-subunit alcohol dehydrogenase family)